MPITRIGVAAHVGGESSRRSACCTSPEQQHGKDSARNCSYFSLYFINIVTSRGGPMLSLPSRAQNFWPVILRSAGNVGGGAVQRLGWLGSDAIQIGGQHSTPFHVMAIIF